MLKQQETICKSHLIESSDMMESVYIEQLQSTAKNEEPIIRPFPTPGDSRQHIEMHREMFKQNENAMNSSEMML